MASKLFLVILALVLFSHLNSTEGKDLKIGFYHNTCPNAEYIVRTEMTKIISRAPSLAGPLLRMHFHDCFVRGCDASLLLNATNNIPAEKDAIPNLSLRGYNVIDGIKSKLEKACPKIVSCADILALVARDATVLANGPSWAVLTGRRDGNRSVGIDAFTDLVPPFANFTTQMRFYARNGLTAKDLVVLSGAHTIGTSHCTSFSQRLYNFTGKGDSDPSLDKNYVVKLKMKCSPTDVTSLVEMDPGRSTTFDNGYFKQLAKRRGLFTSDSSLFDNSATKSYIIRQATATTPFEFFQDFGVSMIKMGNIGILTGKQGVIRKQCAFIN